MYLIQLNERLEVLEKQNYEKDRKIKELESKLKKMLKIKSQFILSILLASIILGCSKDKQTIIGEDWQVESIKVHADSALQYPAQGKVYTLTFDKKNYSFQIGSNISSGKVKFGSKNAIEFKGGITLVMWDNSFSENTYDIFFKVNKYKTTRETLTLTNEEGEIINFN